MFDMVELSGNTQDGPSLKKSKQSLSGGITLQSVTNPLQARSLEPSVQVHSHVSGALLYKSRYSELTLSFLGLGFCLFKQYTLRLTWGSLKSGIQTASSFPRKSPDSLSFSLSLYNTAPKGKHKVKAVILSLRIKSSGSGSSLLF